MNSAYSLQYPFPFGVYATCLEFELQQKINNDNKSPFLWTTWEGKTSFFLVSCKI